MNNKLLNVIYLAGGYPTPDNPSHGIFNQRAANALKNHVNLTVIQYRIYKPGRKFCAVIPEDGFTRVILCVPYSPVLENKMYYFNNRIFYFFSLLFLRSYLKKADIVHASDGNLSIFASWLKKKFSFKLLAQFIGGDLNQDLVQFYKKSWMKHWKLSLDAVSFNSLALEKRFNELFDEHPDAKVIYRGVDTTKFSPADNTANESIFYFLGGLPDYTTFTHGRNTKGGLNLMKAWSMLDAAYKGKDIKLLFAGPDADIPMVKKWQSGLNDPERVVIFGKIDPTEIADFHRSGNIALIPSLEEGLPNVAMEAAATRNLVIANPVGGIPELITDAVNGLLCESNDETGLYDKMKWAVNNKDQIESLKDAVIKKVNTDFSSKDFGKKYFELYKDILKSS